MQKILLGIASIKDIKEQVASVKNDTGKMRRQNLNSPSHFFNSSSSFSQNAETFYFKSCNNLFNTTVAEISRLAASGMTSEVGASITSSVTIMLRRTGRQCMK